jgi:conjugative relaxase-like TrwC/TraI family protein
VLRVTTLYASSARDSARYYTRYLAQDGPDSEGVWLGRQADSLGLTGVVSTEDLEALLSGRDPATGTLLGRPLVDRVDSKGRLIRAVAGFDATFSAPKSVSVWWALTGERGLVEAHDIAVRSVLEHLERYGATTRVRVNGHRQHPDVNGLTMGVFQQGTSREDDPQLHSHVVVSAKVTAPDGGWMALDARYLKRHQRALGGLYQSVLRAELTDRYGVAWGPIVNGQAEIEGMPGELLEAFSKRTAQVEELLARKADAFRGREGRDPTRWERAAIAREAAEDSRATKTGVAVEELADGWRDEAGALGWTGERVVERLHAAGHDAPAWTPPTIDSVFDALSAAGSTWMRGDVLRAVCDIAPARPGMSGQQWARAVESACDRVIEACTSLDPPGTASARASDGRSVWLPPTDAHLTHERVLAQEERILLFAIDAHDRPARPSPTLHRTGLDVLQAEAAAAVAGEERLVLVVGPAGTGKTTTLRRAAEDLHRHDRRIFAVAPTAKAAKVLRDETGIPADTLAKLLHEWSAGRPQDGYDLPPGTTLVLDESGMVGTGALDQLVHLAVSQRWRLVLVGDPRQLHAVGRGGMFDELCRTSRTHELATIHRFRQRWERTASLKLRAGRTEALDDYIDHGRVSEGGFGSLASAVAGHWLENATAGRSVAVCAETNEHVDALNFAIQGRRRALGQVGPPVVRVAGGETISVGDVVVTRRNDRTLRTDRGEPVRNRDRWTVTGVTADGSLAVSHEHGHGQAMLPADYARAHARLGYAATAHGHQGDTFDSGIVVVTAASTHRGLYVGATRGRLDNRILVVTNEPHQARDVLEQVLANGRADVPAVAQRRYLAQQLPDIGTGGGTVQAAEAALAAARKALDDAKERAAPVLRPLVDADTDLHAAEAELRACRRALVDAPLWRRRRPTERVEAASAAVDVAQRRRDAAEHAAAPFIAEVDALTVDLHDAERVASSARLRQRLDRLSVAQPARGIERRPGMEPPGR